MGWQSIVWSSDTCINTIAVGQRIKESARRPSASERRAHWHIDINTYSIVLYSSQSENNQSIGCYRQGSLLYCLPSALTPVGKCLLIFLEEINDVQDSRNRQEARRIVRRFRFYFDAYPSNGIIVSSNNKSLSELIFLSRKKDKNI